MALPWKRGEEWSLGKAASDLQKASHRERSEPAGLHGLGEQVTEDTPEPLERVWGVSVVQDELLLPADPLGCKSPGNL